MPDSAPLAGWRFQVKDIFNVEGMKTSGGSRACCQSYGQQTCTTETVQKFLDSGAHLVGKIRSVALALSSLQNGREIDFLAPWSSRGDGYQTTG